MPKASEVFKKIRFAKLDPHHDKGPKMSTDDEEHGTVSELEFDQQLKHAKKRAMQEAELKDACWKGYTAVGMKMKNGKKVPNCVPTQEEVEQIEELSRDTLLSYANKVSLDSQKHSKDPTKRSGEKASRSVDGYAKAHNRLEKPVKEDTEQLEEGRPSQRHPLEGHEYHKKTNAELEYIAKDAHKAAEAMKSHNTAAENKYRDQANDSATVRYYRQKHGMQPWYKKKYGHMNEEQKPPFDGPYKTTKSDGTVTDKSGAKHTPMSRARDLARDAMKKVSAGMTKKKLQESRKKDIVMDIVKNAKKKKETKNSDDKFQSEPELSTQIIRND